MPADELRVILGHAFLKASGSVGPSGIVKDEERKVGLAVEAHIRPVHTDYEELLRQEVEKSEAREEVWEKVKGTKKRWEEGRERSRDESVLTALRWPAYEDMDTLIIRLVFTRRPPYAV